MSVYKITCDTGKIYYGSTKSSLERRKGRGYITCSCKDFINPKIELVEKVDNLDNLYERELYYIRNYECVNISGKLTIEQYKENQRKYAAEKRKNNLIEIREYEKMKARERREKYPEIYKENIKKVLLPINCPNCGKQTSKNHLARHQRTHLCKKNIV